MRRSYSVIIFLGTLITGTVVSGEPSKAISSMMDTPASAFDVFLFRLLEQSKCYRGWFGNRETRDKSNLCMTTIEYKFDDNLVEMNFFVEEEHEDMKGFTTGSDQEKEKILKSVLVDVAQAVGVHPMGDGQLDFRLGMIQMTPIRHGWATNGFDEESAREEIAKRTVVHLRANVDGILYTATRNHHGKITFETRTLNH